MKHDPEFCQRVAEAAGIYTHLEKCRLGSDKLYCYHYGEPNGNSPCFFPDVDWNDAMFAAEKVGKNLVVNVLPRGHVRVEIYPDDDEFRMVVTAHESGPRAICEAILKMKKNAPAESTK